MTVFSAEIDEVNLTLTVVAEFAATPEAVWSTWENPRLLERWWGPPLYPATFTRHEFVIGGESRYHMTGPDGDSHGGWWRIELLDRPRRLEFLNGLAGDEGEPVPELPPMHGSALFEATANGTRLTVVTRYLDEAQMAAMVQRGMREGMVAAIGQVDELLRSV